MKKTVLVILDGFGLGENNEETNAIYKARTPFLDKLIDKYGMAKLKASEEAVGIAKGQFGNSEIGHMTIGAGQTIYGIGEFATKLIDENKFEEYLSSQKWVREEIKNPKRVLQLCGLYSSGGVHSNKKHMDAMIRFFEKHNKKISLHLFSDGRDTNKFVFLEDVKQLTSWISKNTWISSIGGRYYGMDRDKRWERTNIAYKAIVDELPTKMNVIQYIENQYAIGNDDEFIYPVSFVKEGYEIKQGQTLCFLNFRSDRIRQIFHKFKKTDLYDESLCEFSELNIVSICEYSNVKSDDIIFEKIYVKDTLGSLLIENKVRQLRIAETEKYAHVTFFFDGGKEIINDLQTHVLVPSPLINTYDLQPEMSAEIITSKILVAMDDFDVCVVNYANADMVGHTGNFEATVKAIEFLDKQLERLYNTIVLQYDGNLLITADHGNADCMSSGDVVVKTHSLAPVPFIVASNHFLLKEYAGALQDIAPTILYILDINKPTTMTGKNLVNIK